MSSFFKSPVDVERAKNSDASKAQRIALYRHLKVITYPQYMEDDKYGNKAEDVCLPTRAMAEKFGMKWLSSYEASTMIEILRSNPSVEEEEIVRKELLTYCHGYPDRKVYVNKKADSFQKFWEEAIAAGNAAADSTQETDDEGIVAVNVAPATVGFVRWMKENVPTANPSAFGGLDVTIDGFGFSKAEAFANAVVNTLRKQANGLTNSKTMTIKLSEAQKSKLRAEAAKRVIVMPKETEVVA